MCCLLLIVGGLDKVGVNFPSVVVGRGQLILTFYTVIDLVLRSVSNEACISLDIFDNMSHLALHHFPFLQGRHQQRPATCKLVPHIELCVSMCLCCCRCCCYCWCIVAVSPPVVAIVGVVVLVAAAIVGLVVVVGRCCCCCCVVALLLSSSLLLLSPLLLLWLSSSLVVAFYCRCFWWLVG